MAGELWRYLTETTADYTAEQLSLDPIKVMPVSAGYRQAKIEYDDNHAAVATFGLHPKMLVGLQFGHLSDTDMGTLMDFYLNYNKARGQERTFEWDPPARWPVSGVVYVARFWADNIEALIRPVFGGFSELRLFLEGYIAP
jgi:hypothetical protein